MIVYHQMGTRTSKQNSLPPIKMDLKVKRKNKGHEALEEDSETCTLSHLKEAILKEPLNALSREEEETESDSEGTDLNDLFYKFVILHAESDTDEALRLQHVLQNEFHVKPGIIFAEMPSGRQRLQNLEDAVNGSAWTVILLTENFLRETWCEFQAYASLVNSVNQRHKYNSVIPVRPAVNSLPRDRTPFALRTIRALEEGSPAFAQQVEKTFQESLYRKQQAIWKREREKSNQQQEDP
ncbi:TIR domain-containing adapter molecule 2 [Rhinatrema bivittatum]|uniref:TIR domain-containing adapter molecule 2 n=1 Tax=Rhinatrema bivittatum TaxID=194408 RepID=UPI00112DED9B|nr:TIR domain-containing adapter molecule 2 [Rhinatrema bivittatum]XP_029427138.1 TIR domain-containing adapter molecule 2 [Rhinatrema bivittatum]